MEPKAESVSDLVRQLLRGLARYAEAVAFDIAIQAGKKLVLFTLAITCLTLALVYLSIGLIRALGSLFFHPAPPYLIIGGILLVAAVIVLKAATCRKKADEDAHPAPEDTQNDNRT